MSRSRKKTPIVGNAAAPSDKPSKVRAHRAARRRARVSVASGGEGPPPKAFGNPWAGEKDGKHWVGHLGPEHVRK